MAPWHWPCQFTRGCLMFWGSLLLQPCPGVSALLLVRDSPLSVLGLLVLTAFASSLGNCSCCPCGVQHVSIGVRYPLSILEYLLCTFGYDAVSMISMLVSH